MAGKRKVLFTQTTVTKTPYSQRVRFQKISITSTPNPVLKAWRLSLPESGIPISPIDWKAVEEAEQFE
jgi:hypothetical protein